MVASRYAVALFEVCDELNSFDKVYSDLETICNLLKENSDLNGALKSPLVNKEDKKSLVEKIFSNLDKMTINFLKVAIDKNRMNILDEVKLNFKNLVNEKLNKVDGVAVTAVSMTNEEIKGLEEKLSKKYNKNVTLKNIVDETVIGGVLVRLGNEEIDGTVKGNLAKLKENLSQVIS